MTGPEWSPNESYVRKWERLAYALVRRKPSLQQFELRRSRNIWVDKCKGLAGPFAITLLIVIPHIAENSSGPIILASLLIAALNASLAVWCFTDFELQHGHCPSDLFTCLFQNVGEFPAFLVGWWWISALTGSFAACARTLSSMIDSVTGHHVDTLMENTVGSFTPLGSPIDIISVGIISIPSIMCFLGMEDSNFLKTAVFVLTSTTTLALFGYAVATDNFFSTPESLVAGSTSASEVNLYAKITYGAALASVGFLGLYTVCKPDNTTLTQHKHFLVSKRFSLHGCVISAAAYLLYITEASVINKVQQTPNLWDGDPPLLWPLQGGWRLITASLAITALSLSTFEFLIPICTTVTKMANDGLLYRNLRKTVNNQEEPQGWSPATPLLFGVISAIHSMLIDTKVLLGLVSCSLISIHILMCCSMIATRYQVPPATSCPKRGGHIQTRPRSATCAARQNSSISSGPSSSVDTSRGSNRRFPGLSFLRNGFRRNQGDLREMEPSMGGQESIDMDGPNDRALLMHESTDQRSSNVRRESLGNFSVTSNVSGYESDIERSQSDPEAEETDVDAVVTEYHEQVRVATLRGVMPVFPSAETSRRVAFSLVGLVPCCFAVATAMGRHQLTGIMLGISSGLLTFLLLVVISRQPQRKRFRQPLFSTNCGSEQETTNTNSQEYISIELIEQSLVPWVPAAAVILHCCLLLQALDLGSTPYAFWAAIGLIIYFSYSVNKSVTAPESLIPTDNIQLQSTPRQSVTNDQMISGDSFNDAAAAAASTSERRRSSQADTVLLA